MANINKIRLSGQTYDIQDSNAQPLLSAGTGIDITDNVISATGGGSVTIESAITSGSTNAVESSAIYDATHVDSITLWTPTNSNSYQPQTTTCYKFCIQHTGDTVLDEEVSIMIWYGSSQTLETLSGNVYQESATTSSVFTSTFEDGKWIIESSSPNYVRQLYVSNYDYYIWLFKRNLGGDFAADSIKDDIIPYISDVETVANNAIVSGSFSQGDNNREIAIRLQRGNGGSVTSFLRLDDLKYTQHVLSTDIQFPTGEVGWSEITPQDNCSASDMPTNKVKVTYSGQTVSAQYRTIYFNAIFITPTSKRQYTTWINWTDTTTPTVDGCSAVTATYDSTDDSVTIELPSGETTYDGYTGTFSIEKLRSNYCQFGSGISSVKYYGDITEDIYTAIAHKQDTLSAGTGISISGNVISATGGGGGNPTVELTQAEYDALVTAGTVSADTYYIITDAQAGDLTQYWTSAQTQSAITEATSGKVNTSSVVNSVTSASTDNEIPTAKAVWEAASGGGKAISAGTNISVTTGETADTINCTLPISADTNNNFIYGSTTNTVDNNSVVNYNTLIGTGNTITHTGSLVPKMYENIIYGERNTISFKGASTSEIANNLILGFNNNIGGNYGYSKGYGRYNIVCGYSNSLNKSECSFVHGWANNCSNGNYQFLNGYYLQANNNYETTFGQYNVSNSATTTYGDSGNTLFSVGNGTSNSARHNAFEIRQNGDIYLSSGGTDIKLQDHLGGGGGMTEDDELLLSTALTDLNDRKIDASEVKSNYQKKGDYVTTSTLNTRLADYETALDEQNVEEVTAYALNDLNERFGGLRIVKITESDYTALTTKDADTLYVVVADPT